MIIARSPLRISLGGGGTDLPSYYEKYGGFLIAAAINKYVYVSISTPFVKEFFLKYSKFEQVKNIAHITHPIIKESMKLFCGDITSVEISSFADIPAGTGLGSSGSFTTALIKALHHHQGREITREDLAKEACRVEMDILKEPIGKQDQYIAAYGGLTCFEFEKNGEVKICPLNISAKTSDDLAENLLLFFTGYSRSASAILKTQNDKSKSNDQAMMDNLHFVKDLGYKSKTALENGDTKEFADLMNVHWEHKKKRSGSMSNEKINEWYDLALKNGAAGGKLIGAGGGGFLMFYATDKEKLCAVLSKAGLQEVKFGFDYEGTKIVV